jgi:CheY-like chemotaxis protein
MGKKYSIIVIEDDEVILLLTQMLLRQFEEIKVYSVLKNGEQAVKYFKENQGNESKLPDLIFLDLSMPVFDGWQFLEEYKTLQCGFSKTIHVYIISSSISPKDQSRAEEYPFITDFIVKPITEASIRGILEKL